MVTARRETILVTGGAGFIGSHAVEQFLQSGYTVAVLDNLSTGDAGNVPVGARIIEVDIRDARLSQIIAGLRPEIVVHCAAQISVPVSMKDPMLDLQVNLEGTARMIEASKRAGAKRFVFISSGGAIYGETLAPASETSSPRPLSYYGVHKLAAEHHVALSGMSFAILRPSNVYGPRQRHDQEGGVVSILARQALNGGPFTITGDGEQSRDFVHVQDVAEAIVVAACAEVNGTWNVGTGKATTINALAQRLECVMQATIPRDYLPGRAGDVRTSCLDAARIHADIGWAPRVSLAEGLRTVLTDIRARDTVAARAI